MDYMNRYLPEDIAVIDIKEMSERFHSRLNAKGKKYCYRVNNGKTPHVFDRRYTHMVEEQLDIEAMRRAAGYLLGTHDFKAFTSNKRKKYRHVDGALGRAGRNFFYLQRKRIFVSYGPHHDRNPVRDRNA